jgi:hypothetical protein
MAGLIAALSVLYTVKGKRGIAMVLSAGVVVVRREKDEGKCLFLRAFKNGDFPQGDRRIPGGPSRFALFSGVGLGV